MSWLTNLYDKFTAKLGDIAAYIPVVGELIKVKMSEGDVGGLRERATELKEAAGALQAFADALLMATEDGSLSLTEGSELALALENVVEEFADVVNPPE